MWRNYLTVGIRALAKNKTYAFINIFGNLVAPDFATWVELGATLLLHRISYLVDVCI